MGFPNLIRFRLILTLKLIVIIMTVVVGTSKSRHANHPSSLSSQKQKSQFSYYTDPSKITKAISTYISNSAVRSNDSYYKHNYVANYPFSMYQFETTDSERTTKHHVDKDHVSKFQFHHQAQKRQDGSGNMEEHSAASENSGMENKNNSESLSENGKEAENLSPIQQALENITTPEQLVPIVNDLTLITLVLLHLPVIVPTILIPLAFFGVGALLIPFVRVNYFINHKDDGEDGRDLNNLSTIFGSIYDKIW